MDGSNWAAVIVALISIVSAFLSGRAARNASKHSADASLINVKTQAETEAYNRARKMDIETIDRQNKEIQEIRENSKKLREKVRVLTEDNERLHEDNDRLRRRITRLEEQVGEPSG